MRALIKCSLKSILFLCTTIASLAFLPGCALTVMTGGGGGSLTIDTGSGQQSSSAATSSGGGGTASAFYVRGGAGITAISYDSSTGAIAQVGSWIGLGSLWWNIDLVIPTGAAGEKYLYAVNGTGSIYQYSIESDGSLSALSPATVALPSGYSAYKLAASPDGKFVFAEAGGTANNVTSYSLDASTGQLTQTATLDVPTQAAWFGAIALDPSGQYLYAANYGAGIDMFSVNPTTGALTSLSTPTLGGFGGVVSISMSPIAGYAYVTQDASQRVTPVHYGADGILSMAYSSAGFAFQLAGGAVQPGSGGKYLYGAGGTNGITQMEVNSDGSLTTLIPSIVSNNHTDSYQGAVSPDGKYYFSPSHADDTLTPMAIDQATGQLTPLNGLEINLGSNVQQVYFKP